MAALSSHLSNPAAWQQQLFNLDPEREQSNHHEKNPILNSKRGSFCSSPPMRIGGDTVEVKGGHIVRSTNRKDRHSKVCTAKGPRDRRVRLSAQTAIKFYDVQDRLGYDRPSKAVDWLMKKAKAAIDELNQTCEKHGKKEVPVTEEAISYPFAFNCMQNSSFLPPSLDSDAIADSIKSFFPVAPQDLRLSLQSFQDPIFQHNPASSSNWHLPGGYDLGHGHLLAQRGTLQSSNLSLVRPWMDSIELQMQPAGSSIGFSGFQFSSRVQGEEHDDGACSSQR